MCGRFVLLTDLSRVVETFPIGEVRCDYSPLNEVYPGRDVYAVGKKMINIRAETLTEKPSFRQVFKKQRCLIIADGFYYSIPCTGPGHFTAGATSFPGCFCEEALSFPICLTNSRYARGSGVEIAMPASGVRFFHLGSNPLELLFDFVSIVYL